MQDFALHLDLDSRLRAQLATLPLLDEHREVEDPKGAA